MLYTKFETPSLQYVCGLFTSWMLKGMDIHILWKNPCIEMKVIMVGRVSGNHWNFPFLPALMGRILNLFNMALFCGNCRSVCHHERPQRFRTVIEIMSPLISLSLSLLLEVMGL